jgi:hypothetical protein
MATPALHCHLVMRAAEENVEISCFDEERRTVAGRPPTCLEQIPGAVCPESLREL